MTDVHRLTAAALVTAVTAAGLTACSPAAPDGPAGVVAKHSQAYRCTGKKFRNCSWRYRIEVRPDAGGEPVTIRVWHDEQNACAVGDHYPACLPKGS